MSESFRDEYAGELDYLYELAGELGDAHPRLAPMLGRDADAGVTRLFQNAAFLFARLRQRLDDDLPEVSHAVVESLFPSVLRPLPGTTVVALTPDPAMKEEQLASEGSLFASRPVDGAPCLFRSMHTTRVRPWTLDRVELASERRELRLHMRVHHGAKLALVPGSSLRLYLAGATSMALDLRRHLLRNAREVGARAAHGGSLTSLADRGERPLVAVAAPRLPFDDEAPPALAALRAYFAWPALFAFVDLPNIDRALALADTAGQFELVVRFDEPVPRSIPLAQGSVRLHCVPVVNVHRLAPIHLLLEQRQCVVRLPRPGMQPYSLETVRLVQRDLAARLAIPFAAFSPPTLAQDGRAPPRFEVVRSPSSTGPEPTLALVFDAQDDDALANVDGADVELHVIDGARAERVGPGDLRVAVQGSPPLVTFENIAPVSRWAPPVFEGDRMWRWLGLLKATLAELVDREPLAAALALANTPAWARWPDAKPGADVFEGLIAVRSHRAPEDATLAIAVDVVPERFAGLGDLHLFGEVLGLVYASKVHAHEAIVLSLGDGQGHTLFTYPPLRGTRAGI